MKHRDERLRHFVEHAVSNTDYYSTLFSKLKIKSHDIQTITDLSQLPILTKDEVKKNYQQLVSRNIPRSEIIMAHTSGTTGSGLVFPTTIRAVQEQWSVWWRYRLLHNITRATWCGYFGGRPIVPIQQKSAPYWRLNWPSKQVMYSAYHISDDTLDYYIHDIIERDLRWLHGYPSIISLIAAHMISKNLRNVANVEVITIGAENLSQHQHRMIKDAFGISPRQHYGMAEGVANISENKKGELLIDEDFSVVEFSDPSDSGSRNVIGTNFTNKAFPLLRYDTSDQVELQANGEKRIVSSINGRSEDYLVLQNGAKVGRLDHILKDAVNVKESQFVQQIPGFAELKIVASERFTKNDEKSLQREIDNFLGSEINIDIVTVSEIEKTKSGKLKFVVSDL